MNSTYHCIYHIIIASAGDRKFLTRVNQDILYNYIQAMLYNKHCKPLAINGYSNHLHVVVEITPDTPVQKIVKEIQVNTTDFIRREKSVFPEFVGWSLNYIVLTYHKNQLSELKESVFNQFSFHQKFSFDEELSMLISETEDAKL